MGFGSFYEGLCILHSASSALRDFLDLRIIDIHDTISKVVGSKPLSVVISRRKGVQIVLRLQFYLDISLPWIFILRNPPLYFVLVKGLGSSVELFFTRQPSQALYPLGCLLDPVGSEAMCD